MDETTHLLLPYILAAQAQKHVTHNEALRKLDALVQLSVADRDLAAPPGSPVEGLRYIVAASPSGAWAGQAGRIAAWQDGAWAFFLPRAGWTAWIEDESAAVVFNGTAWVTLASGGVNPTPLVGVNATADATNRLSVSSPASLFNHAGAGHQAKINKATPGDTGTILFQTGFSGRAEMGLAGSDDFSFKVSPDGSAWFTAVQINRTNGACAFPNTPLREVLAANRTYYVDVTNGNDANTGLAAGSGNALQTLAAAFTHVAKIDFNGFVVTIQLADGTYNVNGFSAPVPVGVGQKEITHLVIQGNVTTPANVVLNCTAAFNGGIACPAGARCQVQGITLTSSTANAYGLQALNGGALWLGTSVVFGAFSGGGSSAHIAANNSGIVDLRNNNYTISGGLSRHILCDTGGVLSSFGGTVTLTGTPAFSTAFALVRELGAVRLQSTYSGSATGKRYDITLNGVINVFGAGANYLPGGTAGTTATGGQYA